MREINISNDLAGKRFDKYLFKYLDKAPASFIYKMLRKKNITLNDKKSDGSDLLSAGDVIKIFMTDETISNFSSASSITKYRDKLAGDLYKKMPQIVYEDRHVLIANKPKGMLSQKAEDKDISFNEIALSYLANKGEIDENSLKEFTPSICNRLDRNTQGLIIFAKSYVAAKEIGEVLRDRTLHKYYRCIVKGKANIDGIIKGSLTKDNKLNKVTINNTNDKTSNIYTQIATVWTTDDMSELEILLLTGKTHQIRAHLASIGHPLIGDYKYGDPKLNDEYKKKFNISSQMLVAYKLVMPKFTKELAYLSEREFSIKPPNDFVKVRKYGNVEV